MKNILNKLPIYQVFIIFTVTFHILILGWLSFLSYLVDLDTTNISFIKLNIGLFFFSMLFSGCISFTISDFRRNKTYSILLEGLYDSCKSTDCSKRLIEYQSALFAIKLSDINSPNRELYYKTQQLIDNRLTYEFKIK